jgi:hypothetical protein
MRRLIGPRRWLVLLGTLAVGGTVVGGVVAGYLGPPTEVVELQGAIEREPLQRVATIPASGGAQARDVFVQRTSTGHLCLWDTPTGRPQERQGGCNPADDPLGGAALSASLGYDGGPELNGIRDARIVGLAAPGAAAIRIVMSDETVRTVALRTVAIGDARYQVFAYRIRPSDIRRGLGPIAVTAVDAGGNEIGRQPTGFGE